MWIWSQSVFGSESLFVIKDACVNWLARTIRRVSVCLAVYARLRSVRRAIILSERNTHTHRMATNVSLVEKSRKTHTGWKQNSHARARRTNQKSIKLYPLSGFSDLFKCSVYGWTFTLHSNVWRNRKFADCRHSRHSFKGNIGPNAFSIINTSFLHVTNAILLIDFKWLCVVILRRHLYFD